MAWYAYCIGEKQAFPELARHRKPVPLESVHGVSGNQVFLYPASDLAVIVSEHNPAEQFGQKSGMDHARVIADCFQHSTVLPFRFGTVFTDDESPRKRGQITTMGMLLDPLADKIMVTGALIALVAYIPEIVKVWITVVIIGREFLITGLRSIAASEGFTIQASDVGKLKTVVQIVFVVSSILAHHWFEWSFGGWLVIPVRWTAIAAGYFTVLVSTVSAIDYFVGFWKQIDHASNTRRRSFVLSRNKRAGSATSN